MTTIALTYTQLQKKVQTGIESVDLPSINWKAVCFLGILISSILLVFYAWQINSLTQGFYLVNTYKKEINKLSEEKRNLETSFAESSFLGQALAKIEAMNFQKTTSVKYIQIPDNSLANLAKAK